CTCDLKRGGALTERSKRGVVEASCHYLAAIVTRSRQLKYTAASEQRAAFQNGGPIAQGFDVRQDVRREKYCLVVASQLDHQIANFTTSDWVEARHRLIEEHDLRVVH